MHDAAGRLLLIRRAKDPGRGLWSLPGGRVEAEETDETAVIRELWEETGLDVIPGTLVGKVVRGPYEVYDYACSVRGGTLRPGDDAADARWVDSLAFAQLDLAGALTEGLGATLSEWNALPRTHHPTR